MARAVVYASHTGVLPRRSRGHGRTPPPGRRSPSGEGRAAGCPGWTAPALALGPPCEHPPEPLSEKLNDGRFKAAVGPWAWRGDYLCEFTSTDESFFSLEAIQAALAPSYAPMFGGA